MKRLFSGAGWLFGTALGVGLFPVAPATLASLVAVAVYAPLPIEGDSPAFLILVAASLVIGPWACGSLIRDDDPDPKRAVWDEVAGVWLTCLFLPKTLPWLAAAFLLFRILDILKPWPHPPLRAAPRGLRHHGRRRGRRGHRRGGAELGIPAGVVE